MSSENSNANNGINKGSKNDRDTGLDFSLVLASSVHDMKNSVGMLLNSLEDVINSTPAQNQEQRCQFGVLQYEASRINSELIQLLSIYRMQNNRMPVHVDEHFVIDVFEEQLARNYMLFETRGVHVDLDCDADLNWFFDSDLIGSVVHNVLVNCARYTHKALCLKAELEGQGENRVLCISIADDGRGYPAAMLTAEAANIGMDNSGDNTHLGLFFARKVAQMHCQHGTCGRIQLENNGPLGGGVFKLYLP